MPGRTDVVEFSPSFSTPHAAHSWSSASSSVVTDDDDDDNDGDDEDRCKVGIGRKEKKSNTLHA